MAQSGTFRKAFNGFHREDVVRYIEYITSHHQSELAQLRSENQALQEEIDHYKALAEASVEAPACTPERESELLAQIEALTAQLAEAQAQLQAKPAAPSLADRELEAYRRAEQVERAAKARAEQLYKQANSTLAEATTRVDAAAIQFRHIAERVTAHMAELQEAVQLSKDNLLDATAIMYSIRPESTEE